MKIIRNIFIIAIIALSFSGTAVIAQNDTRGDYVTLAPLPNTTTNCGADAKVGDSCTTTLQKYLPEIFNLSIGIAAIMAFVMITFGGITYVVSDSIGGKADGRKYIENALYGLVLVIGAYAILYTINPAILEFNLNLPKPALITEPTITAGGISNPVLPAGVTIKSGVSLNGIQQGTLDGLSELQSSCGCNLLVTSGTEGAHVANSDHYSGNAVDLSPNPGINSSVGAPSSPAACSTFSTPSGGTLLWEPKGYKCSSSATAVASNADHWHISF